MPWLGTIKSWLGLEQTSIAEILSPALSGIASGAARVVQGTLARLVHAVLELVLFLIILFFLLRDGHRLGAAVKGISPLSDSQEKEVYEHLSRTMKGVLQSMVLVPLAQGLLAMLGFYLFGLPAPLFWGTMLIFAAVVPGVGSPLVWVPAGSIYL